MHDLRAVRLLHVVRPLVRRPLPPHHQGVKGPVGLRGPAPFRVVQDGAEHVVHRGVGKGERVVHDAEPAREERLLAAVELDGPPRQVVLGLGPRLAPVDHEAGVGARGCPAPPPQDALRLDPGRHLGALPGDGDLVASGRVVDPLVDDPGRREAEQPEQERGPGGVPLVARLDRRRRPPRRAAEAGEEESQAGATEERPAAAHPDLARRPAPRRRRRTHPGAPAPRASRSGKRSHRPGATPARSSPSRITTCTGPSPSPTRGQPDPGEETDDEPGGRLELVPVHPLSPIHRVARMSNVMAKAHATNPSGMGPRWPRFSPPRSSGARRYCT